MELCTTIRDTKRLQCISSLFVLLDFLQKKNFIRLRGNQNETKTV